MRASVAQIAGDREVHALAVLRRSPENAARADGRGYVRNADLFASTQGVHAVVGLGTSFCGSSTTVRQERHSALHEQWVLGFLAAVGFLEHLESTR
jgi:hypothetical protein